MLGSAVTFQAFLLPPEPGEVQETEVQERRLRHLPFSIAVFRTRPHWQAICHLSADLTVQRRVRGQDQALPPSVHQPGEPAVYRERGRPGACSTGPEASHPGTFNRKSLAVPSAGGESESRDFDVLTLACHLGKPHSHPRSQS